MQANTKRKGLIQVAGSALLVVAAVLLGGCATARPAEPADGEVVTAFIGDLSASATATGQVLPRRETTLSVATPGQVVAVYVRAGDTVKTGDGLVQLDTADLALNVASARQALRLQEANLGGLQEAPSQAEKAAAKAAVASAQAQLDELLAGPGEAEVAAAEANFRAAEASLASASAELTDVQATITDAQIQAAQAALLAAQQQQRQAREANEENPNQATDEALKAADQAVAEAQAQLDTLLAGPDQGQLGAAQGSVTAAAARADSSEADLNVLLRGATAAQIAAAEAQLAQAEATLAGLLSEPSAEEIAAAKAEVAQARISLADAEAALTSATVVAPFDGIITAVHVGEGEIASGAVVELVDTSSLEVILEVDEVDVAQVAVGQPATIMLAAWPDETIESQITAIAPSAQIEPGSALVTYDVRLSLSQTESPVRVGMTADASLVIAQKKDVLLVPSAAINVDRSAGTYHVNLVQGEEVQEVEVTIGLRDDQFTEIRDGLAAGDELLIGNSLPTTTFAPGDGEGPFSGGNN